jgi:hypothetical protein
MPGIFDTLGLGNVESDPNALPDGKWIGDVFKSQYVEKNDGTVAHVLTYRVTDGDRKGAQRQEWFELGTGAVKEGDKIVDVQTPTMPEDRKSWYKLRLESLNPGVVIDNTYRPEQEVGKQVYFGTKRNGAYINVNFVEIRNATAPVQATTTAGTQPAAAPASATPSVLGGL